MNIIQKIRKGIENRFAEKAKNKNLTNDEVNPKATTKIRELYYDNEDLGFC